MHDLTHINTANERRIETDWPNRSTHPHCVVVTDGLHVVAVHPMASRLQADNVAAGVNAEHRVGVHAVVR